MYNRIWVERLRQIQYGDTIVDAGAFFGGFTQYAAKKVGPPGRVISFEPDPENFAFLKNHTRHCTNVTLVNKALSDSEGRVAFQNNNHYSSMVIGCSSKSGCTVETTTLDKELDRLGIKQVDLLKMNIEGAEILALAGAQKTLDRVSHLAVSTHPVNGVSTAVRLRNILSTAGFAVLLKKRVLSTHHLDLYAFKQPTEQFFSSGQMKKARQPGLQKTTLAQGL